MDSDFGRKRLPTPSAKKYVAGCLSLALLLVWLAVVPPAVSDDSREPSMVEASRRLLAATVTVRVRNPEQEPPANSPPRLPTDDPDEDNRSVSVCTGVVVAARWVVSPVFAASDSEIRITIPGGDQLTARPRVLDEYTGLALLETQRPLSGEIVWTSELPPVGAWVLSAAAWGTEQPAVSLGILGAAERLLAGTHYPPLLQCDLRTAATSSGAAVVDSRGRLIGVVVATDADPDRRGWAYAVPAAHVQRLLNVRNDEQDAAGVVILKRRRPVIGMVLDGRSDGVVAVSRVFEDSPAARAGIRVGDQVVAADGIKIRSVYQAVRPLLHKQPGDKMRFLMRRDDRLLELEIALGGGLELPSAPFANLQQYLQPKLDVHKIGSGRYSTRGADGSLRAVVSPDRSPPPPEAATADEKIQLLERALDRYQQAIAAFQDRLQREEQQRRHTEEQVRLLQQQIEELQQAR